MGQGKGERVKVGHGLVTTANLLLLVVTSVVQVCSGAFSVEWVIAS